MKKILMLILFSVLFISFSTTPHQVKAKTQRLTIGFIEKFKGVVKVKRMNAFKPIRVRKKETRLFAGDIVRTRKHSWSLIKFLNKHRLLLEEDSILYLPSPSELDLKHGRIYVKIRKGIKGLKLKAGIALIGVKGTEFAVDFNQNQTLIYVKEGKIKVSNSKGMFKRYLKKQQNEFETYKKKELEEFRKYKEKMEKEFYEYVKSFELKKGGCVKIVGNKVYQVKISPEFLEGFKLIETQEN